MGDTGIDFLNDMGIVMTYGMVNVKKGRVNVPFSGAQMGEWAKGWSNILTGEQMRDKTDDFYSSGAMKTAETVAGAIALTVATFGAGSALGAGAGAAGAAGEGTVAASAAAPSVAGTEAGLSGAGGAAALTEGGPIIAGETAIPLAAGVSPTAAEVSGASLLGRVGATAAPVVEGGVAPAANTANLALPVLEQGGMSAAPLAADSSAVPGLASNFGKNAAAETATAMHGANAAQVAELGNALPALNASPTAAGWWASLSPGTQTAIIMSGMTVAQMATGGMSGLFQGVSAQKRLELDQLINSQRQNQMQYLNSNNQYAPLLTFKSHGLANTPGA